MAATNFTPIILYHTTTASAAPTAGNLNNGELAINITDGKLFYKDNGGTVQVIATKGTGTIGGSTTQVQYNNAGALAGSANFTFNGTTATINTLNLTNALGTAYGGTALTTYTQGDLVYASAANTLAKLGIGANTYILTSTGSVPQWSAPSAVTVATANNLAGGAAGSVPYQSGASTTTFLSIGTSGQILSSTGSAPQWSSPAALTKTDDTNVTLTLGGSASTALVNAASLTLGWTGQLSIARGGTNATATPTAGAVAYGTGTAYAFTSAGTSGQILTSSGAGAPTWTSLSSVGVTTFSAGTTGFTPSSATSGAITLAGTLNVANGGTGLTSLANGRIPFGAGTSAFGNAANFNYDSANVRLGVGSTSPATTLSAGGATSTTLGFSIAPGGWNNALHRLTVPVSGDNSVWSFNWDGAAVDFSGYATSSITIGQGNVYIAVGAANTAPSNVAAFSTNLLAVTGAVTSTADSTFAGVVKVGKGGSSVATNTAVGFETLNANTSGTQNTAVGYQTLKANQTGSWNTALGLVAMNLNESGTYNTGLGYVALSGNISGSFNTAVGAASLPASTNASYNTAVGYNAGYSTTSSSNTLIGYYAGQSLTSGSDNTAVGTNALGLSGALGVGNNVGTANTAVGANAGRKNTSGSYNAAFGSGVPGTTAAAMQENTTGSYNAAFGNGALGSNTTASYNTATGYQALYANITGASNTAVGRGALYGYLGLGTGSYNTAVGDLSMFYSSTGNYNTALGANALNAVNTGSYNTAVGYLAGSLYQTSSNSTFIGGRAGRDTTGGNNTFVGLDAGLTVTSGTGNTYVGYGTGPNSVAGTGIQNTTIGYLSGNAMTTGSKNTILGAYTGNQGGLDIRTLSNRVVASDGDGNVLFFADGSNFYLRNSAYSGTAGTLQAKLPAAGLSISTTPVIIFTSGYGAIILVAGYSGGDQWNDLIFFGYNQAPTVLASQTIVGSPAARTYSGSAYDCRLAMASGTYTVTASGFLLNPY